MAHTHTLMHPEHPDAPAEAIQIGYMTVGGRTVGLVLRFADGDRSLLFAEVAQLRDQLLAQRAAARAAYNAPITQL